MNAKTVAAKTAGQNPVSIYVNPQVVELQRKISYYKAEFECLLTCYKTELKENSTLRKKVRLLEKVIVMLTEKQLL